VKPFLTDPGTDWPQHWLTSALTDLGTEEPSRNNFPFSVARDSVESAWLGILPGEPVIAFGSTSWSPAFTRPSSDGWRSQRLNRLKAGLQPGQLGLLSHDAELISGQFLTDLIPHKPLTSEVCTQPSAILDSLACRCD